MGLMGCLGCTGEYEIGLERCPRCGTRSPMYTEGEDEMPKTTIAGTSNAWEEVKTVAAEVAERVEHLVGHDPVEATPVPQDAPVAEESAPAPSPRKASKKAAAAPVETVVEAPVPTPAQVDEAIQSLTPPPAAEGGVQS